ncbi:DUF2202 domain-containing protein [Actinoplanes sp. NPDC049599]|uniref:DUF2202 domain-containing protein n=1 Tax=Actinoplanes sp. NPDC049599 TaxID=3363903 RepID=UPI0037AF2162
MADRSTTSVLDAPWRDRAGFCGVEVVDQPAGSIDPVQRAHLRALAVRIKIVHDLLAVFADAYTPFPAELVGAQTRELIAVRLLLDRYAAGDPGTHLAPGVFADAAAQRDYDRLRARGRAGRSAALQVIAATLSETVTMLEPTLPGLTAPDVRNVYFQLLASSLRQLRIVQAWSAR